MAKQQQGSDWLPLRTVSQLTGLTPDLIRAWEKRYDAVQPQRGPRGARVYSLEDVRRLRLLARAVEAGRAIGDVARLSPGELERLVGGEEDSLLARATRNSAGEPAADHRLKEEFWAAVRAFDPARLERALSECLAIWPLDDLACRVLAAWIEELGEAWNRGEVSVAQEHFVSAALRNFLGQLLRTRQVPGGQPQALLATPAGERHEFGLLLAGLLFADRSIPVVYLGADVPDEDLLGAARALPSRILALSVVDRTNRPHAAAVIRKLVRSSSGKEIWLGGRDARAVAAQVHSPAARLRCFERLEDLRQELRQLRLFVATA